MWLEKNTIVAYITIITILEPQNYIGTWFQTIKDNSNAAVNKTLSLASAC